VGVTFAVAAIDLLDRDDAEVDAQAIEDQPLEPIEAIDDEGPVVVGFVVMSRRLA
jgi:hypothetical protein